VLIERVNIVKLISPDFVLGRMLVGAKAILELAWFLVGNPSKRNLKFARLVIAVKPKFTMVGNQNLKLLYDLVSEVIKRQLPGDIVECGVWNGGSAAIMGVASMEDTLEKKTRGIWLFDSFEGLPPPGDQDGDLERQAYFPGWNKGNVELVQEVFGKFGYPSENLKIVPGWFNETIIREPIEKIAILHIDADWYESVKTVLELLYPRVVPGGFVVLDDYGLWPGCQRAVLEYFSEHEISEMIIREVGKQGAYFRKPV
jgi:O-methyltransferase